MLSSRCLATSPNWVQTPTPVRPWFRSNGWWIKNRVIWKGFLQWPSLWRTADRMDPYPSIRPPLICTPLALMFTLLGLAATDRAKSRPLPHLWAMCMNLAHSISWPIWSASWKRRLAERQANRNGISLPKPIYRLAASPITRVQLITTSTKSRPKVSPSSCRLLFKAQKWQCTFPTILRTPIRHSTISILQLNL